MVSSYLIGIKNRIHIFTGQVWSNKSSFFKFFLILIDKLIVFFSTDILTDSLSQKNFLIKNNIINKKKIFVMGQGSICGVNTKIFSPNIKNRNLIRTKNKIKINDIVIIYAGRFSKEKGTFKLVKCFEDIQKNFKKKCIHLILVGNDESNISQIIKQKLNSSIKVVKFTKNLHFYLQASDIFCLPSEREGFGISAIQASACGLPIACSNIYGLKDAVKNNLTGLKFNLNNNKEIIRTLKKLIINSKLRSKLGKNGIAYIKKNFEQENIIKKYEEYYQKKLLS